MAFSPTLINNCTFNGNKAEYGGGMFNFQHIRTSSPTVTNCIFWGNDAGTYGDEIYNSLTVPTFSYCDINDCYIDGEITVLDIDFILYGT